MSERPAVRLAGAGKMYRLFPSRTERLLDAFGLAGRLPFHRPRSTEFWALRGIDLELPAGRRIGVIGRNGAGKSTMLKLISGHLEPTEGVVEVDGTVDSLSEPGGGFHPDFTGAENVRMALTLRGLSREQIDEALAEIAEFTELGDFLARPFGTYSSGMKARLAFAASTSLLAPRVLLVDEVLGAGDAYFISKSAERMASVVASGATIIVVSHALDQVTRICEEVLWLDRGHLVARGPCLEVVKAYQQFMNVLDDRRLRDRNRRAVSSDAPRELRGRISVEGPEGAVADIAEVTLVVGERREPVRVGEAQDTVPDHDGRVVAEGGAWSDARSDAEGCWRTIPAGGAGLVAFRLDAEDARRDHALEVRYRLSGAARASLQAETERDTVARGDLAAGEGWRRQRLPLGPLAGEASRLTTGYQVSGEKPVSRWVGGGALRIAGVRLLGGDGRERAVFEAGTPLTLEVTAQARDAGEVDWLPAAVLYRREDGLLVARYIGETARGSFAAGGTCRANLVLDPVRLGNGHYVLSVGLYGTLDLRGLEPPLVHDLVDRSYEFAVVGTPPLRDGVFLPAEQWRREAP